MGCIIIWRKSVIWGQKYWETLLFILSCLYYMMNWAPSFLIFYVNLSRDRHSAFQNRLFVKSFWTSWPPRSWPRPTSYYYSPCWQNWETLGGLRMFERTVCWSKFKWFVKVQTKRLPTIAWKSSPYRSKIIIKNENLRKSVVYYEFSNICFTNVH